MLTKYDDWLRCNFRILLECIHDTWVQLYTHVYVNLFVYKSTNVKRILLQTTVYRICHFCRIPNKAFGRLFII